MPSMDHQYFSEDNLAWLTDIVYSANSQKPKDELYSTFKESYPGLAPGQSNPASSSGPSNSSASASAGHTLTDQAITTG